MTEVGRAEFDRLALRLDQIDAVGTRGVAVLAVQIQELAKDIATHEAKHDLEERKRIGRIRYMVMAIIAVIAAIDGPIVTVLLALHSH